MSGYDETSREGMIGRDIKEIGKKIAVRLVVRVGSRVPKALLIYI